MTHSEICAVLDDIKYKDWDIVYITTTHHHYIQVRFKDEDGTPWSGRKWLLSSHMTRSEIVQTALKAVLTAEEHEARERFLYRGRTIFGPHLDVDKLHELTGSDAHLDARTPA